VIVTAKAFVDQNPQPSDAQIQQAMSTVLCRCFAHTRMLRAIRRYVSSSRRTPAAEVRE
jgi:nicotinate dehydrogenase subunit A